MSEAPDESIQLEQVKEVAPKPKRVYKKSTKSVDSPLPRAISPEPSPPPPPEISPVPSPISNDTPVAAPVIKEKKARTQKQIDAFNKMREAYLNKHKTPIVEPIPDASVRHLANEPIQPVKESEPVKQTEQIKEEPWDLGTKKVQKPRAKKNKPVATQEEPQIDASMRHLANNPVISQQPAIVRQVSTAPRFVFV